MNTSRTGAAVAKILKLRSLIINILVQFLYGSKGFETQCNGPMLIRDSLLLQGSGCTESNILGFLLLHLISWSVFLSLISYSLTLIFARSQILLTL